MIAIAAALVAPAAHTQTTNEGGYEVTRTQANVPVPRGKLGRKTIDRQTRVGNTEETDGNSVSFAMTLGGFVNRCPVPEGSDPVKFVLPGEFEYSLVVDTVDTDVVPTERKHYEKRVNARIKGFVNDDLSVTEAEFDGEYFADIAGVRTGPVRIQRRFRIGQGGMPDMEALQDIAVTSDIAAAALIWNASQTILLARPAVSEPNVCAELVFDPPSESHAMASGDTVEIRVKYRTRDGQQPIPRGRWGASVVNGGQVPTNDGQVREDGTFVVKYTARTSGAPRAGDGARIEAGSAGGYGRDEWKILVDGDYELEFESSIVSREPVYAASSTARGSVRLTGSTKPYKLKPDGKLYRLYDGDGDVAFHTQSLRSDPCDPLIAGSGTSKLSVVDTFIQITPPQQVNGAQVGGQAEVVLAYSFSMGAGETETVATMVNYQCVPGDVHQVPFWWSNYLSGRGADGDVNFLRNWDYVGRDDVVARKTLRGNCGGMCSQETSVFTLRKVAPQ